jgi:dienelactone hydrolase
MKTKPSAMLGVAALLFATAAPAQTPRLTVTPDTALIDSPLRISATGLKPGQRVVIAAVAREDSGQALVAQATFVADAQGKVDLTTDAPLEGGTYGGVDAMGLLWSGVSTPAAQVTFPIPAAEFDLTTSIPMEFTLRADGMELARRTVLRRFADPGVQTIEVRDSGLVGRLFLPPRGPGAPRPLPGVVVFSGSEGGYESSSVEARLLASHGYAALALAYFRAPGGGVPDELALIPLEYFKKGITWFGARPDVDERRVAIWGGSRGAELVMLLGATYPDLMRAIVAYAPVMTMGAGLTAGGEPRRESAWTLNGAPLPVMQVRPSPEALAQFSRPDPVRLRLLFEPALKDTAALARAAIPVERIQAAVMLVSGADDQMGPSDVAADMMIAKLEASGHSAPHVHLKYQGAGHLIGPPYLPTRLKLRPWRFAVGGTPEGYARADADSWGRVLRFLAENL